MTPAPDELDSIPTEAILTGGLEEAEVGDDLRPLVDLIAAIRTFTDTADASPPAGLIVALAETASTAPNVAALPAAAAPQEKKLLGKILTIKAAVVAGVLAVTMTGAAAATGSLPDAAQDGLAEAASHIGINLPDSASDKAGEATTKEKENNRPDDAGKPDDAGTAANNGKAGEHGNSEDQDGDDPTTAVVDAPENGANEHGVEVSGTAQDDSTEGREHGETVSTVARDGHGTTPPEDPADVRQDADNRAEQSTTHPTPPETPNTDGATTADDASGGRSTARAGNAEQGDTVDADVTD